MNEFGYTAWGLDVLRLVEPISATKPEPMLPRARSIARNQGVTAAVDGRDVRATVHRGSEASVVGLEFAPMTRELALAVAALGVDDAALADEHHATLVTAGLSPAPTLTGTDCSCRARSARCLHVLAALYDLTRRIDETPVLALRLQGLGSKEYAADHDNAAPAARWWPVNTIDPRTFYDVAPLAFHAATRR